MKSSAPLRTVSCWIALTLFFLCAVATQSLAQGTEGYFPTGEWRTARPQEQGLDKKIIKQVIKRIRNRRITGIDSLLIVRNGYLVTEQYFNGWSAADPHTTQSNTKSITSLLVGIAIDQGKIRSVDDQVLSYFPEYSRIRNRDERKEALSIRDLLTMRTGLNWSENVYQGSPLQQLNTCECDWLKFVLDWPMREWPGERFEYNSGGVIVLGGIVRNATGMRTDDFAQRYLFNPLGIRDVRWVYGALDSLLHTGGGLSLRPRDMAKIGYLLLRNGRWEDQQIVSAAWLRESLQRWVPYPRTFHSYPTDYGYLWWLLPLDGTGSDQSEDAVIYTAAGAQGQWILAIPRYDMVVVVTGSAFDFAAPLDFFYTDILRAVQ